MKSCDKYRGDDIIKRKSKIPQVTEPNSVAEATGEMNKAFLDTLHIAMALVADDMMDNDECLIYKFNVSDYTQHYGLQFNKSTYRKLRKQIYSTMKSDTLLSMSLGNGKIVDFFVFQEIEYDENDQSVTIMFTQRFKSLLVNLLKLKGRKIYFALTDTLQMGSEYATRMYPILLEWIDKPMTFQGNGSLNGQEFDRIDTVENFRNLLNIPSSYVTSNIKNTCEKIVEEINRCTPYNVEVFYNQINSKGKAGYKITHIAWTMRHKETTRDNVNAVPENTNVYNPTDIVNYCKSKGIKGVGYKTAEAILTLARTNNRSDEDIREIIDYSKTKATKSVIGYIKVMMAEYKKDLLMEERAEQIEKSKKLREESNAQIDKMMDAERKENISHNSELPKENKDNIEKIRAEIFAKFKQPW